jgi:hypothetical protein
MAGITDSGRSFRLNTEFLNGGQSGLVNNSVFLDRH